MGGRELRDVEQLLRLAAEQSPEHAFMLMDAGGRFTWWSPGAEHIFGYPRDEMIGQPSAKIFVGEDNEKGLAEHEMAVAIEHGPAEDDRWQERMDGSRFWATGALVALRDPDGSLLGFAKILRNRTDLKEQLETLRNHGMRLDQEARRKDVFLSTLSHELRNPLAPLANSVKIIRMTVQGEPDVDYALKVIERQVDLLHRLVDDLLDLTRITAGKVELKRRHMSIQEVIEQAVDATQSVIADRKHQLEMIMPPATLMVDVDPDRMSQVFVNLLTNAAKYTPAGGTIWVKVTMEGNEVVARVEDNGVGIPTDMLPKIFELFTQVESSRSMSQGGLGIGLSLVKDLVTLHGGSVQVRSEGTGKGSDFAVRLPAAPEEPVSASPRR
jgi:PAS domain S-box-containing protein